MTRLSDKFALVTGAAQGIGAAIARAFVALWHDGSIKRIDEPEAGTGQKAA